MMQPFVYEVLRLEYGRQHPHFSSEQLHRHIERELGVRVPNPSVAHIRDANIKNGPGAELMQMFSSWGLPPCSLCHATARKMNALGVDGCREQLEELTDEIVSNSERHPKLAEALSQETAKLKIVNVAPKWLKIIGVRRFIVQAIDRAEKTKAELSAQKKPPVKAAP